MISSAMLRTLSSAGPMVDSASRAIIATDSLRPTLDDGCTISPPWARRANFTGRKF
jgi:hypothetical protein